MKKQRLVKMPLRRPPVKGAGYIARQSVAPSRMQQRSLLSEDEQGFEVEDYEDEAEPNMKFSHALLVVLALHVIAVGGIIAFNSIKSSQSEADKKTVTNSMGSSGAVAEGQGNGGIVQSQLPKKKAGGGAVAVNKEWPKFHTVVAGDTLTRVAATYGTSIEAIERANGLTMQSVLRIGQVLEVPEPGSVPVTAEVKKPAPVSGGSTALRGEPSVGTPDRSVNQQPVPRGEGGGGGAPAVATKAASLSSKPIHSVPVLPAAGGVSDSGLKEAFLATRKPDQGPALNAAAGSGSQVARQEEGGKIPATYTVIKGDNPYSIAKKYGVSYKKLLEINGITDPTKIQIGQVLKMPIAEE